MGDEGDDLVTILWLNKTFIYISGPIGKFI